MKKALFKNPFISMVLLLFVGVGLVLAGSNMSVQVKKGRVREKPSFLSRILAEVEYGGQVLRAGKEGDWIKVSGFSGSEEGWMHASALTPKRIVFSSGQTEAGGGGGGEDLALAGKGFNKELEVEFRGARKDLDYLWVDRMEAVTVAPGEIVEFVRDGGLKTPQGGM